MLSPLAGRGIFTSLASSLHSSQPLRVSAKMGCQLGVSWELVISRELHVSAQAVHKTRYIYAFKFLEELGTSGFVVAVLLYL